MSKAFYIAHFNDVYDIEEQIREPCGGCARFLTLIRALQQNYGEHLLTLFSGDVFSPSALSSIYKGEQMVFPMNEFKVDVACLGNHDFDYPLDVVKDLFAKTNIPWMLSNVYDAETGKQLANALQYYVKNVKLTNGEFFKVGFIGLAEEEWLGQITTIDQSTIQYQDFVHAANYLCPKLRQQEGCQYIIALTHMRIPNDQKLIHDLEPGTIDLVLGGHDHVWHWEKINQTFYLKSGTNFRNLSLLRIDLDEDVCVGWVNEVEQLIKGITNEEKLYKEEQDHSDYFGILLKQKQFDLANSRVTLQPINITKQIPADEKMIQYVQQRFEKYHQETQKIMGFTNVALETRFSKIRYEETNFSNLYADLLKAQFGTDVAVFNTGTIRSDEFFSIGSLTIQTFNKIFAIPDLLVSFSISGENLHKLLENGVCKWPSFDGRFLGVAGIRFIFDPSQPQNNRILKEDICINGFTIDYERMYSIATKYFIASGKDGFRQIPEEEFIIGVSADISVMQVLFQFFETVRKSDLIRKFSQNTDDEGEDKKGSILKHVSKCPKTGYEQVYKKFAHIVEDVRMHDFEPFIVVAPIVDGRIIRKE